MHKIKNWDNKNWLSSIKYINLFNKFLTQQKNLNKYSKILDIGCGRGRIIGNLALKLRLKTQPIGIDVNNHQDKSKKMNFKKVDAISFFKKNKKKFDIILIKQSIHFIDIKDIKSLLISCTNCLNPKGKILIFFLENDKNGIPTFNLMNKKLLKSLKKDQSIIKMILQFNKDTIIKKFTFRVCIQKKKYFEMIKKRYISILLNLTNKEILIGINELNLKYGNKLKFYDTLKCMILKK